MILARITCVQAGRKPCAQDGRAHLSVPPARSAILTLGKNENFQRLKLLYTDYQEYVTPTVMMIDDDRW